MATLNIGGKKVKVGDDFLKLTPEQQNATVAEIAKTLDLKPMTTEPEGPPAPAETKRGMGETFGRAALQGAAFNFGDELAGVRNAGSDKIPDAVSLGPVTIPLRTLAGGARLAYGALTGDDAANTDYEKGRDEFRTAVKEGEHQNPITSAAGNVTGALASGLATPGGGATLPIRIARGIGIGAGSGFASGVGEGEDAQDRIGKGLVGGAIGGAVGGVAAPVVEGIGQVLAPLATGVRNAVRGYRDPEGEAARRLVTGIRRDVANDPDAVARLTPDEYAASIQNGGPARNMDLGGETTRSIARSAANQSPEARAGLDRTINDRFEGQTGRVNNWLRETFHYPDADAQRIAIDEVERTVNRANYRRAYQEGDREIITPELERLLGSPAVADAMKRANVSGKDRAIDMGYGAFRPGVTIDPGGAIRFNTGNTGVPQYPNLAFWDATKKELDNAASRAVREGSNEAGTLTSLAQRLRGELDSQVSSYRTAREGASGFFGAENALEAGENFLGKDVTPAAARRALAQMSPQERQLFQDGFVSKYMETLNHVGDRRNILNKIAESPTAQEKLNIALGPRRARELEAGLRVEQIMDFARGAVQGNSTTARQLAELGLAGAGGYAVAGGGGNPMNHPEAVITGLLTGAVARGRQAAGHRIETNVARSLGRLLTSQNPDDLRRGVQIIARSEGLTNSLRNIDKYIARVAGEEASGAGGPMKVPDVTDTEHMRAMAR